MSKYLNSLSACITLTKPAIQFLLLVTALSAIVVEGSMTGNPGKIALLMLLYYFAGGSAKAFNQIFEAGNDAVMTRTKDRPIPSGRITRTPALIFASILSLISVVSLWIWYGIMPSVLTGLTILFYGFFYTLYLKPRTSWNIVFGGLTGSMAPVIGWISAGGKISAVPLIMGAFIFFWSPPHFWTLTLYHKNDYAKAAFPTVLIDEGEKQAWNKILLFSIVTILLTGLLPFFEFGSLYLCFASIAGILYLAGTITAFIKRSGKFSKILFFLSIIYLFLLFSGILLDKLNV